MEKEIQEYNFDRKMEIEEIESIVSSYKELTNNLDFYKSPVLVARNFYKINLWKDVLKNGSDKLTDYKKRLINNTPIECKDCNLNEYFGIIKGELKENRRIREQFDDIKNNLGFLKSPVLFLRNSKKVKYWREALDNGNEKFEVMYRDLRDEYGKRFDHLNDSELFQEYEKKIPRYLDLEERKEYIKWQKAKVGTFSFGKKRQIKELLREFKDVNKEFKRRKRDLEELLHKIENERNLSLEVMYTGRIKTPEKKLIKKAL